MEQAVNLFSKGLQIDTNPMVQGDDTLSDALNATFVTMNGNEVILLNDMGNRRVDHAFLPAGYEPVGMKEYGGIIYVASYNPITNRSLIGSFPSPERRISEIDDDSLGIGSYYSFGERFFGTNNIDSTSANGINFLKNDSFMDSLTSDTSLHAGDKFSIYSDYIWKHESDISNFNQYDADTKKVDPKNKLFTLAVGVMNSLNEFVDITSSLERFKKGEDDKAEMITDYDSDSEKFNKGYFIAPTGPETNQEEDILPKEREKLAVNTYAYKLVGPLQLKTTLNHILNFDFTLAWETTSNPNIYKLIVTGIAVYNCPDKLDSNENSSRIDTNGESVTVTTTRALYAKSLLNDINYKIYEDASENGLDSFDLFLKNGSNWEISLVKEGYPKLQTTYDINTNTFTSTCTKIYNILVSPSTQLTEERFEDGSRPEVSLENTIIDYYICVKALAESYKEMEGEEEKEYKDIYLKNLSYQGSVDVNKIGSNIVELNGYRYYYDKTSDGTYITMTFQIDAFPSSFTKFTNFKVAYGELKLVEQQWEWNYDYANNTLYQSDTVPSGRVTFTFKEEQGDENGIKPKNLYELEFSYIKESTIENNSGVLPTKIHRFLLTTPLFNSCYSGSNDDYTEDYGLFMGDIETRLETGRVDIAYNNNEIIEIILENISKSEQKRREEYLNVKLEADGKTEFTCTPSISKNSKLMGNSSNEELKNIISYLDDIDVTYSYKAAIKEINNYPAYIELSDPSNIIIPDKTSGIETSFNSNSAISIVSSGTWEDNKKIKIKKENETNPYLYEDPSITRNGVTYRISLKYFDRFYSTAVLRNVEYGTIYVRLNDPIMQDRLFPSYNFGFLVTSHGESSHNWHTYLGVSEPVRTEDHADKTIDSSSSSEGDNQYGGLGFKDASDPEYRMGTALEKLKSKAEDFKMSFLYMFTDVENRDGDNLGWHPHPANDEYFYNPNFLSPQTEEFSTTPYFLDLYTLVFCREYATGDLFILRGTPFQYRADWELYYNPTYPNIKWSLENMSSGYSYGGGHPLQGCRQYRSRNADEKKILENNFKQEILDFIGKFHLYDDKYMYYVIPISNYNGTSKYFTNKNLNLYNNPYTLLIKIPKHTVEYNSGLTSYNLNYSSLLNLNLSDKTFLIGEYSFERKSDENFNLDCEELLNNDYISGIFLDTGEKVPLPEATNTIYVYKGDSGTLVKVNRPPFIYSPSVEESTISFKVKEAEKSNLILSSFKNNLRRNSDDYPACGRTYIPFKLFRVLTKDMLLYHDGN